VNGWAIALAVYVLSAALSFIPVARKILSKVELHPGGASFEESSHFSEEAKEALAQHFSRIRGTLEFWKTQAAKYKAFHSYSVVWVTVATASVPFLAQAVTDDPWSRWFLTIVGAHATLLLALARAFRVENYYKAFRHGESEFYDTHRRLLDRPEVFGDTETEQLSNYFEQVEVVRKFVRTAETDNLPSIEDIAQDGTTGNAESSP
jgi:hypothetical protein